MSDARPQVRTFFKEPKPSKREQAKTKADYVSAMKERTRRAVFDRDGGCVVAGERWVGGDPHVCTGPLTAHHRRKASALGSYTMDNLVTLCATANRQLEDEPDELRALYPWLIVREGDPEFARLGRKGWRG